MSMPDLPTLLPLSRTVTPSDQTALAEEVRAAHDKKTPVYPIGGGTALDYGLPAKEQGLGISTAALNRIVDYPARDMTITIEAGITMSALAKALAVEGQRLPIEVPFPDQATLGGVIATNWSGPRRYGHGTIRDYVIGVSAVDGRGVPFKAGGRVVKNVAGYDFCKLLTGSLGTLAVITQVTLKVKPIAAASAVVCYGPVHAKHIEVITRSLVGSRTAPVAIDMLGQWKGGYVAYAPVDELFEATFLVGLEGAPEEVDWMIGQLEVERQQLGANFRDLEVQHSKDADDIARNYQESVDFATNSESPLVVRFNVPSGQIQAILKRLYDSGWHFGFHAHAANGILQVAFEDETEPWIPRFLLEHLQPWAVAAGGNVVVLGCPGQELTRQHVWGASREDSAVMQSVKRQFDPAGILNPGRFVY